MFERRFWIDKKHTQVAFVGDMLKLQNVYGAWAVYTYTCVFDVKQRAFIQAKAKRGHL